MANSAGTDFGFLLLEPGLPESQHPGSHDHVAKYLALRNAYARTAPKCADKNVNTQLILSHFCMGIGSNIGHRHRL